MKKLVQNEGEIGRQDKRKRDTGEHKRIKRNWNDTERKRENEAKERIE